MSHPTHQQIAQALGIPIAHVHRLARRGMPTDQLHKALAWHALHGRSTGIVAVLTRTLP